MDISQNSFTKRVVKPWKRLHREEIESPSLEVFKRCIYVVLMDMVQWWTWQIDLIVLKVFCDLTDSMILFHGLNYYYK